MAKRSLANPIAKNTNQFADQFEMLSTPEEVVVQPKKEVDDPPKKNVDSPEVEQKPIPTKIEKKTEDDLLSRIKKRKEKKKIEDTHTRQTFLIKNELNDKLTKLYKKYGYGFKTEFINDAIEKGINAILEAEKTK